MRLNLGCGSSHFDGYLNVDKEASCNPDKVQDLEVFPWDFEDDSVDKISMYHVLEHLGETSTVYLKIIKELYRICIYCIANISTAWHTGFVSNFQGSHPNFPTLVATTFPQPNCRDH